jgi:hypothetical protein
MPLAESKLWHLDCFLRVAPRLDTVARRVTGETAMNYGRRLAHTILLVSGIGFATAASAVIEAVAAPDSADLTPAAVVLRGSAPDPAQPSVGSDGTPVVLRGSPPSIARPPAAVFACPSGYGYDPTSGCMLPGYAYAPDDFGYWPDYGFGGFSPRTLRRRIDHGFARGTGRGSTARFGRRASIGFGHGFAHAAGFGHR